VPSSSKHVMKILKNYLKKTHVPLSSFYHSQQFLALLVVIIVGIGGVVTLLYSHAASGSATLSISPSSQTVTTGSDITITVSLNPEANSINTVQTVVSYPSADFSLVSAVGGSSFGSFVDTPASGSVSFTAGASTPVTGTSLVTVATITLQAIGTGTSLPVSLATVCPTGDYALTCSAAYDATTNDNDLGSIGSNASYTVNPLPPSAPTNLQSTATTTTSISLSWTTSTDSGGTLAGYYLYRYVTSAGAGTATKIASPSASATTYSDTGLSPGTSYSFYLEAYDTSTPVGVSSPSSTLAVSTVALPTAPSGLTNKGTTTTSVSLSWTASTDSGGPGLAGYYVYRYLTSAGASTATKITTLSASTTSYLDTGLTSDTSYSYYVIAYDSASPANVSAPSSTLSVITAVLPTAPSGLTRTGASITTISLSWTASTDSGGPGVAGYYVFRNSTKVATVAAPATSYIDTSLSTGTSYNYYVEAYDSASTPNVSSPSSTSAFSTSTIEGDIDGDDMVTGHDLSILLSNFGTNYPPAEFDGANSVEGHDLSILLSNYGK
jgi:hypothetical protein